MCCAIVEAAAALSALSQSRTVTVTKNLLPNPRVSLYNRTQVFPKDALLEDYGLGDGGLGSEDAQVPAGR